MYEIYQHLALAAAQDYYRRASEDDRAAVLWLSKELMCVLMYPILSQERERDEARARGGRLCIYRHTHKYYKYYVRERLGSPEEGFSAWPVSGETRLFQLRTCEEVLSLLKTF